MNRVRQLGPSKQCIRLCICAQVCTPLSRCQSCATRRDIDTACFMSNPARRVFDIILLHTHKLLKRLSNSANIVESPSRIQVFGPFLMSMLQIYHHAPYALVYTSFMQCVVCARTQAKAIQEESHSGLYLDRRSIRCGRASVPNVATTAPWVCRV